MADGGRVAIDARKLRDFGIGTYIRNILVELHRIDADTPYVVLSRSHDLEQVRQLVPRFRVVVEDAEPYSLGEQVRIPWRLRREGVSLVHEPHYVLPPLTPCRSVVTIHDCIQLMFPQYLPNRLAHLYARAFMWTATRQAARILTVSEASKRDILRFFAIPADKVQVIYNAIDGRFLTPPDEATTERVRQRYQLDHPFVLYVGNIKPHKNIERTIDAFGRARVDGPAGLKLVIVGDEVSKYPSLRQMVHRHKLDKHVRFLGFQPQETLASFYRLARAFVFPSLYRGVRAPPSRGDGLRHTGHHLERLVAARGGRRRRAAGRSVRCGGTGPRDGTDRHGPTASRQTHGARPDPRAAVLVDRVGGQDSVGVHGRPPPTMSA